MNRVDQRRIQLYPTGATEKSTGARKGSRKGPVVYWMSRDQRVEDNWALVHALDLARTKKRPCMVLFCLVDWFKGATLRQYRFMIDGLLAVEGKLRNLHVPLVVVEGDPGEVIPASIEELDAASLVMDFSPLKIKRDWNQDIIERSNIPFHEVDAHNIVPCWLASKKQEYSARFFRPKLFKLLPEFLTPFPQLVPQDFGDNVNVEIKHSISLSSLEVPRLIDRDVKPVTWLEAGASHGDRCLENFLENRIENYVALRNDPTKQVESDLSPYLHFGHISAQRVALEVRASGARVDARNGFIEQLVVRRELSDNFCYYNRDYDSPRCFPNWAKTTLKAHESDAREYIYSLEEFERGNTHDPLWNAAQLEMVQRGKMHNYMRMYWAKKILEWTETPKQAMDFAMKLNDKYELDGRDPNGYVGIAWSIGGVHDRAWKERPVLGKVRFMSYNGAKRKFDVEGYIKQVSDLT
ncbi:deoxyribodipyrimidine photo-lyase [Candidatus Bathyarchaeota archaeon]|nr:deoxyribodipyrimidine photo-lyase [Candidatus Bathyarchaeota archaeon]